MPNMPHAMSAAIPGKIRNSGTASKKNRIMGRPTEAAWLFGNPDEWRGNLFARLDARAEVVEFIVERISGFADESLRDKDKLGRWLAENKPSLVILFSGQWLNHVDRIVACVRKWTSRDYEPTDKAAPLLGVVLRELSGITCTPSISSILETAGITSVADIVTDVLLNADFGIRMMKTARPESAAGKLQGVIAQNNPG